MKKKFKLQDFRLCTLCGKDGRGNQKNTGSK